MEHDPKVPPYSTSDKTSFAYISARDRWPVILTGAIDDLHRSVAACNEEAKVKEGKSIVESLAKLKYEVQHNRELTPLPSSAGSDIESYNTQLSLLSNQNAKPITWFTTPWLYAECYLYRRLSTLFSLSTHWQKYDVFSRQKLSTFRSSRPAVLELASRCKSLISDLQNPSVKDKKSPEELAAAEKLLFTEMAEICLWGNATDLSLLTSLTYDDIQKLQGAEARKKAEANIVVNDLPLAYEVLKQVQTSSSSDNERQVDIVLDNSGFELYVDLLFAGYLLASGLATRVVLHPKSIPWFVSDVTPPDFAALLNALADPQTFFSSPSPDSDSGDGKGEEGKASAARLTEQEESDVKFLFGHLAELHGEGKMVMRASEAWTGPGSFWRLKAEEERLCEDLRGSEMVVYKGDLNYRKLAGDVMWPSTTSFSHALGPLGPGSGIRTLALRTCKADVVVGLPDGKDAELCDTEGGGGSSGARKWAWSGKWAVVQFCNGKEREAVEL